MAIWPLNRKKGKSDLPKEVQDYYQAEKRERVGVAGLLALGTLILTVLLAIGLFFGGRWAYRAVVNNDKDQTAQTGKVDDGAAQKTNQPVKTDNTPTSKPEPAPTPTPSPTPSASTPAPGASSTPSTPAASNSDLPNTGPADTLAIIAAAVAISSTGFYLVRRPQEQ